MVAQPQQAPPPAPQFERFGKDRPQDLLDPQIGRHLQAAGLALPVPHRDRGEILAPPRLRPTRLQRPQPQAVELVLIERALQPEQQPIIAAPRVIDGLLVDEQRIDQPADLDQPLPIAAVAREARDFPRGHGADLAQRHLGHQPMKPGAVDAAARRAALVLVDDLEVAPSQGDHPLAHRVLQPATLVVMLHLMRRRLPHVDDRPPVEMTVGDLLTHGRAPRRASWRRARRAACSPRRPARPPVPSPAARSTAAACAGRVSPAAPIADPARSSSCGGGAVLTRGLSTPDAERVSSNRCRSAISAAMLTCGRGLICMRAQRGASNIHAGTNT